MYKTLKLDIYDNMAIINLTAQQKYNAYDNAMAIDLLRAFEEVEKIKDIRAVLLRATGKAFCVGGDINMFAEKMDHMPADIPDMMEVLNTTITTMINLSKPILVAVHGAVAGVGLSLMLACDLAIAANSTKFTLAYSELGVTPDGGATYLLPRIVGMRKAMQMILLPEIFNADKALQLGLVNWVVDETELNEQAMLLINKLADGPSIAYRRAKELINHTWQRTLDNQLMTEMHAFTECTTTQDFRRGVTAFLNKSKPSFTGN